MVVESFARGGAERQILGLTEGLLRHGYAVHVFELIGVVDGQSSFVEELAQLGVGLTNGRKLAAAAANFPVDLAALDPFRAILPVDVVALCRALALTIQEFRPGIVHSWSNVANVIGGIVSGVMGVPRIVLGLHASPPPSWYGEAQSDLYREAYRRLADDTRLTLVNDSGASTMAYQTWLQCAPNAIKMVHNGFAPSSMKIGTADDRISYRAHLGLPADAPVVGGLMRFAPEKDPGLWIESAAAIASKRPDVWFVLGGYGHGKIADELYQAGIKLGLGRRLVMPGAVKDIGRFYGALDAFFLTSRSENLGLVLIEAQAAGLPLVGPAVGGVGEAMLNGVTGLLVSDRSPKSFAAAVLQVLNDPAWRKRAAAKGPRFVARRFGQERMVHKIIRIYSKSSERSWGSLLPRFLAGRHRR
jgi:glycosyltransferase involved in cell wall biosynthesis